jgi:hypothetical protein
MRPLILVTFALASVQSLGAQDVILGLQKDHSAVGNGSLEGTVINEVTHEPVRQAQVMLGSANASPAVTDSTGRFAFRNLGPGTYWLQAVHPLFPQPLRSTPVHPLNVTLAPDAHKRDLVIALTPGATISGRVLDEDRKPVSGCSVQALEFQPGQPDRRLSARNNSTSDSRGRYRIYGLPSGRYYLMVQCQQMLPAPHPLIRIGPDTDLPQQRYNLEFYPGPPDSSGSGRLLAAAGADLRSIDFQVRPTAAVTLRGRFRGVLEALRHNPWVQLVSREPLMDSIIQYGGTVDTRRNTFRMDAVPPGHYTLVAVAQDDDRIYQAKMPIDIGVEAPGAIEIAFLTGAGFTGSIVAGDESQSLENVQVRLLPLDWPVYSQGPHSKLEKGGTFTLSGVMPGRWRLQVDNLRGYVKSFMVGDQPASPHGFNIGPGTGGVMRIVMSVKFAQIDGTLTGTKPEGANSLWLMAVPDDPDRIEAGHISFTQVEASGHFMISGIEPGKYRLYGLAGPEPWAVQQSFGVLRAIADRGIQVDLEEGAQATAQVATIPIEELSRAIQEQE